MRIWYITAVALAAFTVGCNKSTTGGTTGPGGTKETFSFTLPTPSQDVKQGETKIVEGTIKRDADFKKDVKIKVESTDKKVDVKVLNDSTIKASDAAGTFKIEVKAEKDASIGVVEVKVTGSPDGGGNDAHGSFKVNVTK